MIFDFFAAGVLLWFVGYLHRVLRRAEGDVESLSPIVLGAGIGVAVTTAMAALPTVVLAFMDAQPGGLTDLSLVRMLGDLNTIFFSVTSIMTGVFFAALGWAMVRGELGRGWLGWVALVVAVFNAIAVWIGVTFSSYHGKAWLIIGWGAYIGFLIVMLILSVSLLRRRAAPAWPPRRHWVRAAFGISRGPFLGMATAASASNPIRSGGPTSTRRTTRPLSRDYGGDARSADLALEHRAPSTRHLRARGRHAS